MFPVFVRVLPSALHGFGVFAAVPLAPRTCVGLYQGTMSRQCPVDPTYALRVVLDVDDYLYIDSSDPDHSNFTRYINDPGPFLPSNCEFVQNDLSVEVVTTRAINQNEELTAQYLDWNTHLGLMMLKPRTTSKPRTRPPPVPGGRDELGRLNLHRRPVQHRNQWHMRVLPSKYCHYDAAWSPFSRSRNSCHCSPRWPVAPQIAQATRSTDARLDELIQLQARMIALEEQRQAQTERLLADVRPRPVPLERQAPLVNYQESSFGPFPSSVQASQAPISSGNLECGNISRRFLKCQFLKFSAAARNRQHRASRCTTMSISL